MGEMPADLPVAVDVMGGDHAPVAPIRGAVAAVAADPRLQVTLVGPETRIEAELASVPSPVRSRIGIVSANQVIGMDEAPVRAVRKKRDASLVRTIMLVREGKASAAISAGHTGALMAAGLFLLDRLPGVERPALSAVVPSFKDWGFILLDAGANLSLRSDQLVQYAYLGALYVSEAYAIERPRVALLNIGEEAGKGPVPIREAFQRLSQSDLNFVGNIESREVLQGKADVVVTDGFTGNVVLKLTEGVARDMVGEIRQIFGQSLWTKIGGLLVKGAFQSLKSKMNYQEHGGAPLLGLVQSVYKCHGSSQAEVIAAAVRHADAYHRRGGAGALLARMQQLYDDHQTGDGPVATWDGVDG